MCFLTHRRVFVLSVAVVANFAATAILCAQEKPLIAFAQEGLYNSWRTTNNDSILKEGEKSGYKIQWVQAEGDQSKQVAQVQDLLKLKPKLLIVEPAEQQAATPIAALADQAGIPLIVADRGLRTHYSLQRLGAESPHGAAYHRAQRGGGPQRQDLRQTVQGGLHPASHRIKAA